MYTIAAYIMCSVCVLQITDDLRVVATTREQRQKIRAHELLERKEMLAQVNNNIIISLSITSHTLTLTLSHSHTLTHTPSISLTHHVFLTCSRAEIGVQGKRASSEVGATVSHPPTLQRVGGPTGGQEGTVGNSSRK